jgi:hypothetical protein
MNYDSVHEVTELLTQRTVRPVMTYCMARLMDWPSRWAPDTGYNKTEYSDFVVRSVKWTDRMWGSVNKVANYWIIAPLKKWLKYWQSTWPSECSDQAADTLYGSVSKVTKGPKTAPVTHRWCWLVRRRDYPANTAWLGQSSDQAYDKFRVSVSNVAKLPTFCASISKMAMLLTQCIALLVMWSPRVNRTAYLFKAHWLLRVSSALTY